MPTSSRGARARLSLALALALIGAGCFGTSPTGPTPRKSPGGRAGEGPAPGASLPASPALTAGGRAARNAAPREGTRLLEATVRADAGWVLSTGGGAIISSNGASVLRLGATLLSDNGLGLVSNNSGNVVVADGERLVLAGGTLLSDNGLGLTGKAKLISDNGLGVIANNGAGVIANNGAGVIGQNGAAYALAQAIASLAPTGASAAPAGSALGESLPAAQMMVGAIDLHTGAPVPVGVDEAGEPVYAVFSDGAGRVRLHVPAALAGNVRLVALPPDGTDERLRLNVIAAAAGGQATLDDDEAQVTALWRGSMARRLAGLYAVSAETGLIPASVAAKSPALAALATPIAARFKAALDEAGGRAAPPRRVEALALVAADPMLADLDLEAVALEPGDAGGYVPAPGERAMPAIRQAFQRVGAAAAAKLRENPRWFEDRPYVIEANRLRRARLGVPYEIRKPTDLTTLLALEYLASNENLMLARVAVAFADLGLPHAEYLRLRAAAGSLFLAVGTNLLTGVDPAGTPVADLVERVVRARGRAILEASEPPAAPPPEAYPPAPPPAAGEVVTLAGTGAPGLAEGAGAAARFAHPAGLALDGQGRLYVADPGNARVRAIDLRDPAHPVTTVAGGGTAVAGTVPALGADLTGATGLAMAPGGKLYVATGESHRIWCLDLAATPPTARLVAGGGTPAPADGQAPGDAIRWPYRLAIGPDRALYFVERLAGRLRRLVDDGGGRVETVFDGLEGADFRGLEETRDFPVRYGPIAEARLGALSGLAFDAKGQPVVAGYHLGLLARLRADGVVEPLAGGLGARHVRDAFWLDAAFREPHDVAYGPDGRLYLADAFSHRVRVLVPPGDLRNLAGSAPDGPMVALEGGFADGPAAAARFDRPMAIAVDADGTVYVADTFNHRIRAIRPAP